MKSNERTSSHVGRRMSQIIQARSVPSDSGADCHQTRRRRSRRREKPERHLPGTTNPQETHPQLYATSPPLEPSSCRINHRTHSARLVGVFALPQQSSASSRSDRYSLVVPNGLLCVTEANSCHWFCPTSPAHKYWSHFNSKNLIWL